MNALLCLTVSLLSAGPAPAWTAHFQKLPPEREVIRDARTQREIVFLTSPDSTSTLNYPTCRSWTADGRFVIFESIRPRPGERASRVREEKVLMRGPATQPTLRYVERQLMAADVETGDLYWLAPLEVEDTASYGDAQLNVSIQFHADLAPLANRLVYYDMTGHHLYLLDLDTGRRREIWHMTDGTIGDPPSISPDGTRVVFYAGHPGPPENERFRGDTFTIYALDLDPKTGEARPPLHVVTSLTSRKGDRYKQDPRDWLIINHCQINPKHPDLIGFAHQWGNSYSDGSYWRARIWTSGLNGAGEAPLTLTPARRYHTHEVWGPQGDWMYYVNTGDVERVHRATREVQVIAKGLTTRANHINVSEDERIIVADSYTADRFDADDTRPTPLFLIDAATGKSTTLAVQPVGQFHPRHAHPSISPRADRVGFTVASGSTARVAVMTLPPAGDVEK